MKRFKLWATSEVVKDVDVLKSRVDSLESTVESLKACLWVVTVECANRLELATKAIEEIAEAASGLTKNQVELVKVVADNRKAIDELVGLLAYEPPSDSTEDDVATVEELTDSWLGVNVDVDKKLLN